MLLTLKNNWKHSLSFLLTALLIVGLVYSRALLSIASIGLLFACFNFKNIQAYKNILLGIALIILPVLLSGFWSENKLAWWRSVEVKLSLLVIIVGILTAQFSIKKIKQLGWCLTIVNVTSAFYSLYHYFLNEATILNNYLVAKVMPVLMDDDHIRYSWLIVLNIIFLISFLFSQNKCQAEFIEADSISSFLQAQYDKKNKGKQEQWIAAIAILFLIAYLHFLAAKTGLLCLYVSLAIVALYLIIKVKWWAGILLLVTFVLFAFTAYKNLPSLQNRVQYVLYDFSNYSKGIYIEGSSDGARVLSIKAGIDITKQHLLTGVGFGDVQSAIVQWHDREHPSSKDYERFLPTNQWLIYSAGSGLIGIISFSVGLYFLLQPVFSKNLFSILFIVVLLIPLITDDSFEGQYGVSVFALFVGLVKRGRERG